MDTITIAVESSNAEETVWRAASGNKASLGKTAGEALDKLTPLLDDDTSGALVVIQPMRPAQLEGAARRAEAMLADIKAGTRNILLLLTARATAANTATLPKKVSIFNSKSSILFH